MLLKTSTRTVAGVMIVDCAGRIVLGDETAFLRHQVKDLLIERRHLVLNLSDVNYMDSGGIGMLVGLYSSAANSGGKIKLAGLPGRVKDVLQITKLGSLFEFYNTPEEAASTFNVAGSRSAPAAG